MANDRSGRQFFFPNDGSEEWLHRSDAYVSVKLLSHITGEANATVLEVGVWKGAWTSVMLKNMPQVDATGIDPYPMSAAPVRSEMLERLEDLGVRNRFTLYSSWSDIHTSAFSMVHVDGEHSERAALRDLAFAFENLAPGGVVVVDDFRNKWYPGVASALYQFLKTHDARLFLATDRKAYIARRFDAQRLYAEVLELLQGDEQIQIWRWFRDNGEQEPLYPEPTDVLGQPVLIARPRKADLSVGPRPGNRSARTLWTRARRRLGCALATRR